MPLHTAAAAGGGAVGAGIVGLIGAAVAAGGMGLTHYITKLVQEGKLKNIGASAKHLEALNDELLTQLTSLKMKPEESTLFMAIAGFQNIKKNATISNICVDVYNDIQKHAIDGWYSESGAQAGNVYKNLLSGVMQYLYKRNVLTYNHTTKRYTYNPAKLTQGCAAMMQFGNVLTLLFDQLALVTKEVPTSQAGYETQQADIARYIKKYHHIKKLKTVMW